MLARIRKALVAGLGAGAAAATAALIQSAGKGSVTQTDVATAVGLAVTSALTVGLATYATRNAGLPGGSEPPATAPSTRGEGSN